MMQHLFFMGNYLKKECKWQKNYKVIVKMHKTERNILRTIYKLPGIYRKLLATNSWMCYFLITATETLPVTIPIPIPKH